MPYTQVVFFPVFHDPTAGDFFARWNDRFGVCNLGDAAPVAWSAPLTRAHRLFAVLRRRRRPSRRWYTPARVETSNVRLVLATMLDRYWPGGMAVLYQPGRGGKVAAVGPYRQGNPSLKPVGPALAACAGVWASIARDFEFERT